MSSLDPANPFAQASDLPYGLPPFRRIREEHYLPAFRVGMAEQLREVRAIVDDATPVTPASVLDPLEASGALLSRVSRVFVNLVSSSITDGLREIEAEVNPLLAAHRDRIVMDAGLFAKISELYARRDEIADEETRRLLMRHHDDMVRAGAALSPGDQERLRAVNQDLAQLAATFREDLRSDTNDLAVHLDDVSRLEGLPADAIAAARAAAQGRGLRGYLLTLILPTGQPALAALKDRQVRQGLHLASVSRGRRDNAYDTRATLTRLVTLRAQRAELLGFENHAAYVVADQTAKTVDQVMQLLTGLVGPAVENARQEQEELTRRLHADGVEGDLQPWDWAYYSELVAQERFSRDASVLRPYFELNSVLREGVFAAAGGLYGLHFVKRDDLHAYADDVDVYEVFDEAGAGVGLVLTDWYTRDSKRGGAWMNAFADQSHLLSQAPVTVINLNLGRPPQGSPTLLTLDEVRTTFHEFGHVLHGLLSDVRYPTLSGTEVPRDCVEFPSQVNEMWAWQPELLRRYARHHETGEALPADTLDAVLSAQSHGQGQQTVEMLAACLLDQAWHQRPASAPQITPEQVDAFEQQVLAGHGLDLPTVPPRYGTTYFEHIFGSDYSAGYYSYLWSEVLDADTVEWFLAGGGLDRALGRRFRDHVLSRGGAVDPMAAVEKVLGRPPRLEPLLERRGLLPVG
ncbi:M3 family metallopeptidase [Kineosporia succinea]|uniref:Peptidyl-dipeptidase Dcp n=1 Tax=Kineosporia succinea TaxID=84632 RepID=A0ABT9P453_9ACTN|nr:M3 family metallopeptidase [Kineosporia succinea]MDP9826850.1 peptidyl-dipeptidase Dcp [Kineosporia succinea]